MYRSRLSFFSSFILIKKTDMCGLGDRRSGGAEIAFMPPTPRNRVQSWDVVPDGLTSDIDWCSIAGLGLAYYSDSNKGGAWNKRGGGHNRSN